MNILRLTPSFQEKSGIADYSNVFDKILKRKGIKTSNANFFSTNRSTWWIPLDFIFRRNYWDNLLKNIDIIHAEIGVHRAREILTLNYLVRKKSNLRVFITIHDLGIENYSIFKIYCNVSGSFFSKVLSKVAHIVEPFVEALFFSRIIDDILEKASKVLVFNQWGSNQLIAKYPQLEGRVIVINHPVFSAIKQKIEPIPGRNIVFAGFWSSNKGLETLIRAYSLLIKKHRGKLPRLVLAGETQIPNNSYFRKIRELVDSLGLNNLVDFPGFSKEGKFCEILSKAILVIPYTNKVSGSASGIYIRGLQVGAVTIVSDNPTLFSLAKGHNISLVFKQGEVTDLNDKISEIMDNEVLAYGLAKKGQDFVYKYGNWHQLGKNLMKAYQESIR